MAFTYPYHTIACQLAASVPDLRSQIQQAIEGDKFVVGRTLAVAFQRLLVEPFKGIPDTQTHPGIILDGVDECAEHKVQQQILRLFISAIRDNKLPIRLLIVSRPEPHRREVFETLETFGMCREYRLSADLATLDDIRKYLTDEFHGSMPSTSPGELIWVPFLVWSSCPPVPSYTLQL
jgi:hypothetical protein